MARLSRILKRMVALSYIKVYGVFAGANVLGLGLAKSALLAGVLGVMEVLDDLSRSFLDDGRITRDEEDEAFRKHLEG